VDNLLARMLLERITHERISEREAARQIGVAPTTIGRTLKGESVDIETLLKFCEWLDVKPSSVLNSMLNSDLSLSDRIEVVISAEPKLRNLFQDLLMSLENGDIDIATVNDVIAYAVFRLSK